ncbi:MAG: hypothetical protein WCO56_29135 [Verrucomicrobiota bacterium]
MPVNIFAMFRFPYFSATAVFQQNFILGARGWFLVLSGAFWWSEIVQKPFRNVPISFSFVQFCSETYRFWIGFIQQFPRLTAPIPRRIRPCLKS